MPELTWPGKSLSQSAPAALVRDSIIYPNGNHYPATQIDNRLIYGDNLASMTSLLPECEGRIQLIYADPPFFTNKKFVFANFAIADDCYKLIHSDVRGELYDEKWKFKLLNRSQQTQNVDDVNPVKTYGSNIDENFNNPR